MNTITIKISDKNSTYTASAKGPDGKTYRASCTAGAHWAARRCAGKAFGLVEYLIDEKVSLRRIPGGCEATLISGG